ncbi:MAG TPA: DUF547 domain-containing protein [Planctomycetota bacterium]|nr:DUF547 domain-containing protein [Planctomycetota bacterium]
MARIGTLLLLLALPVRADPAGDFAVLLAQTVREDGVDYEELARGRDALDRFVASLAAADPGAAPADRAAFWINAHNAFVLRLMLDTRPGTVDRAVFFGPKWRVALRDATLDDMADLARDAGGPLVRFALYRAARSSPPLSPVPYRGADLAEALAQQTRAYLADGTRNRFAYAQLEAEISMLFRWYKGDFEPLQAFLADHMPADREDVARSLRTTAWRISFRPWDWSLDEAGARKPTGRPLWLALYAIVAAGLVLLGVRAFRGLLRPLPHAPSPPGEIGNL